MPSRLSPQQFCGNSCTWTHDVRLYIYICTYIIYTYNIYIYTNIYIYIYIPNIFKGRLLQFVKPLGKSVFTCHNTIIKIKYLTKLRLGFNNLRYHKFKHGFLDGFLDPLFSYGRLIENTAHYFLQWPNFSIARNTFLNEVTIIERSIVFENEIKIIQTFLY